MKYADIRDETKERYKEIAKRALAMKYATGSLALETLRLYGKIYRDTRNTKKLEEVEELYNKIKESL